MTSYLVTLRGEAREVYLIEAEDEDDALERWHEGHLQIFENSSMEVVKIEEDED